MPIFRCRVFQGDQILGLRLHAARLTSHIFHSFLRLPELIVVWAQLSQRKAGCFA